MTCINKKSLQVFQKGLLMSINSLKKLFIDVKTKFGIKYILTHRLNQDVLENLFSQIRQRGGLHDHLSPLNALHRLRMIILGKTPGIIQKNVNTEDHGSEEYVIAKILNRTGVEVYVDAENEVMLLNHSSSFNDSSSHMSSDISSVSSNEDENEERMSEIEVDGLHYSAGWIAKRLKSSHPELGSLTSTLEHSYNLPSWVNHLSFGGLTEPSYSWKSDIIILEKLFTVYLGSGLRYISNIVKKLTKKICTKIKLDKIIVKSFVRQRLFIRINYLNYQKQLEKSHRFVLYKSCLKMFLFVFVNIYVANLV